MFVAAGGYLLNTVQFGTGQAAFVAHGGWVGSWELWQEPFGLMQDRWRCIGYDHRGSGASTFPPEAITPEGLVDDLFTVLDHYGVDSCVLAGESLGALTCLQAVVTASPPAFAASCSWTVRRPRSPGSARVGSWTAPAPTIHKPWPPSSMLVSPSPTATTSGAGGRQILLRAEPEAAARIFEAHYEQNVGVDLSRISVPTLVIHGEDDAIVPLALGRAVAAAIANSELVVLADTGHVPTLTRPAEVVEAIDRWAATLSDLPSPESR